MARSKRTRENSITHLNAYSYQCEKLSESDLPMRQVTWAAGLKMVKEGKATWEYGKAGIKGIRFTEKQREQNPTPCTLTMSVMKAVAGEGLAGPHSIELESGSEDKLRDKFRVWALIGDTKAVCVRPKVDEAYLRTAHKLLGVKAA